MLKSIGNKQFVKFLIKAGLFFLLFFILDFTTGSLLRFFYYRQEVGNDYQATLAIDSTKADIVIFGSSRAANLFDTEIFAKRLNMSCFNTGRYGYPIFYHYALLKAVTKRYIPKIAILSFDAGNFSVNQEAYDRLSSLLPYYKNHPEIRSIVDLKGPYEKIKMLSAIYPYNSLLLPVVSGNMESSKKKYATISGYIPLDENIHGPIRKFDYTTEKVLDTVKINVYKAFLQLCINAKIKLYVVCTPYKIEAKGVDKSITLGKCIALEFKIPFLDYSRDSVIVNQPSLFADYRHLNKKGVQLFSNTIAEILLDKR